MKKAIFLLLFFTSLAQAQTLRYVSNTLEVPLRSGPSNSHDIVGTLATGTAVELLRVDAAKGYSLVRVDDVRGWVQAQYLVDVLDPEPSLANVRRALEMLKTENARLKERLSGFLSDESGEARIVYQKLSDENQRLRQELAQFHKTAEQVVTIDEQNRMLHERVIDLERELQIVQQEKQALEDSHGRGWFLVGSGVLLAGLVLGMILPRLDRQKHNRWREL